MRRSQAKPEGKESEPRSRPGLVRKKPADRPGASKLFIKKGTPEHDEGDIQGHRLTVGNLYDYIKTKEDVLCLVFDVFHSPGVIN